MALVVIQGERRAVRVGVARVADAARAFGEAGVGRPPGDGSRVLPQRLPHVRNEGFAAAAAAAAAAVLPAGCCCRFAEFFSVSCGMVSVFVGGADGGGGKKCRR